MITTLILGFVAAKGLLVVDMLAIARLENGKWKNLVSKPSDPVSKLRNIPFTELGVKGVMGKLTIPKLELQTEVAEGWFAIKEEWSNRVLWNGTPVKVPAVRAWSGFMKPTHREVKFFLEKKGIRNATLKKDRHFQVDLDGDGVKEMIIEVSSVNDPVQRTMEQGSKQDFTAILIFSGRNAPQMITMLSFHDARGDGVLAAADEVRAFADFDGDGKIEIVCSADYYEGQSAAIYNFSKGKVRKLIEYGAGV